MRRKKRERKCVNQRPYQRQVIFNNPRRRKTHHILHSLQFPNHPQSLNLLPATRNPSPRGRLVSAPRLPPSDCPKAPRSGRSPTHRGSAAARLGRRLPGRAHAPARAAGPLQLAPEAPLWGRQRRRRGGAEAPREGGAPGLGPSPSLRPLLPHLIHASG